MKKVISILLAAMLVLSLAACGSSEPVETPNAPVDNAPINPVTPDTKPLPDFNEPELTEPKATEPEATPAPVVDGIDPNLIGTWTGTIDMSSIMTASMAAAGMGDLFGEFTGLHVELSATFNEDGTYTLKMDEDSVEAMMEEFIEQAKPGMRAMLEAVLAQQGLTMTLDEYLEQSGMDFDAVMEESLAEAMSTESMVMEESGKYLIKDGKFYGIADMTADIPTDGEGAVYTIEGNKLTLEADSDTQAGDSMLAELFPFVLYKQ